MLNKSTHSSVANSWPRACATALVSSHLRLVEPDHRLGEGVIERITLAPDRRRNADGREANQSSLLADPVFHDSLNDCSSESVSGGMPLNCIYNVNKESGSTSTRRSGDS